MFDEDSLLVRAFGWFVKPALIGLVGWLLIWIAGAGGQGVAAYAALGAAVAYARAGFGWPPNNGDWAPLAGILWPLVAVRDIIPHLLDKPEQDVTPAPDDLSTNVAFLEPPRPRPTA
ncbi:conserved protein of unknown function [Rhodovastum atsumiense]|uniref:Uncharacterized protein n=1 Tax=Rhodovastum atsumiense TaxID=504468 RepID=A0A5M6IW49_9PROT|nr:hypothetical protein [Rhodovastum atsumiense]KAA5612546.1 hypothetical protein F1189_08805 [Rhodovastum atsumiense]CAH2601370.1 conserved protein of unknown function [Rhodovastum atsumiense]